MTVLNHDVPVWQMPHKCDVYRLYDNTDHLLYVGVAVDVQRRLRTHSVRPPTGKTWWPEVAYCAVETHTTTSSALEAERQAIRQELPAYNVRSGCAADRKAIA